MLRYNERSQCCKEMLDGDWAGNAQQIDCGPVPLADGPEQDQTIAVAEGHGDSVSTLGQAALEPIALIQEPGFDDRQEGDGARVADEGRWGRGWLYHGGTPRQAPAARPGADPRRAIV